MQLEGRVVVPRLLPARELETVGLVVAGEERALLVARPLGFSEQESYADDDASIQTAPKVEFG